MMWFFFLESLSTVQSLATKLCSAVIFLYAEGIDVQQRTGQLSEQAGEKRCTIISANVSVNVARSWARPAQPNAALE